MDNDINKNDDQEIDLNIDKSELDFDNSKINPPVKRMNTKMLRIIILCFGGLVLIAIMFAFMPPQKSKPELEKESYAYGVEEPQFLAVNDADYYQAGENDITENDSHNSIDSERESIESDNFSNKDTSNDGSWEDSNYKTYDRRQQNLPIITEKKNQPIIRSAYQTTNYSQPERIEPIDIENRRASSRYTGIVNIDKKNSEQANYNGYSSNLESNMTKGLELQAMTDYEKQNQQNAKRDFLNSRQTEYSAYLDSSYIDTIFPNEIKAGTIIPITLLTGISSDLPGSITAQVITDVYDSLTGQILLIPKGSKVIGEYSSSITFGQSRVLVAYDRIIRPDGISLNLKGMTGVDLQGKSGFHDTVNNHLIDVYKAIGMTSVIELGVNTTTSFLASQEFLSTLSNVLGKTDETTNEVTQRIVEKELNRQPTIEIRAGYRSNLFVNKDIILPPYDDYMEGGFY